MSWRRHPVKHLAEVSTSNVDKKSAVGEIPVRLVNYTDVYYGDRLVPSPGLMEATASPRQIEALRLRAGDVVITKDSETAEDIGVPAYVEASADDMVLGYHLALLRPRQKSVDGRYLYWAMCSNDARGQLSTGATGVTRFGLRADVIGSTVISAPAVAQQRAIADVLDTETARIDALVTKKRRMIDLVRERFWHSVDSKFRALEHVPRQKLTWLAHSWCDGPFGSSLTSAHYSDSGARVIRLGNVGRGEFMNQDAAFVPVEYFEGLGRHEVLEGDLIVAGLGDEKRPLARACVAPEVGPAMVKADCFRFRLRTELASPDFVAWYLSSPSAVAGSAVLAQGSTRARANLATVCGLRVPLPDQSVQQLVVEGIQRERAAMSDVATRLKQQVKLLQERRQALITAAVTGRLEIPGLPGVAA